MKQLLRNQVQILRTYNVSDGMGGQTIKFATIGTLWCSARELSATELMAHGRLATDKVIEFTCYWPGDGVVTTKDRADWGGHSYAILTVENVRFENRMLRFTAGMDRAGVHDG